MQRAVLSTVGPGPGVAWGEHVDWFPPPNRRREIPLWLWRFQRAARGRRAVVLRGTSGFGEGYRDLIASRVLRIGQKGLKIIISDATIEPVSRVLVSRSVHLHAVSAKIARLLVRFADGPSVTWCVLSSDELLSFPQTWKIDPGRVKFTAFSKTVWGEPPALAEDAPAVGTFAFSGGNSLRDYDTLLSALGGLKIPAVVATSWKPTDLIPDGTTIRLMSHAQFFAHLAAARVVVLPLVSSTRSTGQQTYLNAMWLKKPVIVTDAPGVRDYIVDGVSGIVVPNDPDSLRAAIIDAFDESRRNFYDELGRNAHARVQELYMDEDYRDRILEAAELD